MTDVTRDDLRELFGELKRTNEKLGEASEALAVAKVRQDAMEKELGALRTDFDTMKGRVDRFGWKILFSLSPGAAALLWKWMEK